MGSPEAEVTRRPRFGRDRVKSGRISDIAKVKRLTHNEYRADRFAGHIDAFIKAYNTTAAPFAWTKSEVHQKRLKPRFAHQ
jgi:hypothetical protein